ncbi:hypothetical protein E2542_SST06021 [Spatholobus suberectus]|nr:hypothetical protein E2542_SST06021 [Spatholobus suberectus]
MLQLEPCFPPISFQNPFVQNHSSKSKMSPSSTHAVLVMRAVGTAFCLCPLVAPWMLATRRRRSWLGNGLLQGGDFRNEGTLSLHMVVPIRYLSTQIGDI